METAMWLSRQERVEVLETFTDRYHRYQEPTFRIRRKDGSTFVVNRRDILLHEEEQWIAQLAKLVYYSDNPAKDERYGSIMKQLLRRGVPYAQILSNYKPSANRQLSWFDVPDAG